jgi:hypothetical protein
MDMNGVKFGPPLGRKRTKPDSPKEVAGMDMSGAKFGPPSRKKRKKQDGSSTTDIDPVKGLTSSTCDRNLMVSPTFTFNDPYKYVWQIVPILSPASVKRLADFDQEVGLNGFQIGNEKIFDVEDVARTDEKEGEAIKMAGALRSHGSIRSCCQEIQTHEEGDIGDRSIEVDPLSQENLKEASPSQEVIDGGQDSSTSARTEIPCGVGGVPQVCSCKLQHKDLLMIFQKSSAVTQPGPKIGTHLELSNIAKTFGVSVSPSGPSDTPVVVLAHRFTPADTTTSNILNLRLQASLAANAIISVTRTQGDGFRLVWIEFRSPDNARRFRHAALSHGGAPFFCEQVHHILFDAACASPGSDSKEWVDPKGLRRKRKKKVTPLI